MRFASPLMMAGMAGLLSERSGVINIALEGFILFGAFASASAAYAIGDPWIGLSVGCLTGALMGMFYGGLTVGLGSDQIVAGTAMNVLAWGGIPFIGKTLFDSTANTPPLEVASRLPVWAPIVVAVVVCGLVYFGLRYVRFGLWLTFAGEKPEALAVIGVRARLVRMVAVTLSGGVAALGGGILSIALSSSYTRNMSAGRGFMALAALILGKWKPIPTAVACLLFGLFEVLQLRLQGHVFEFSSFSGEIPGQIVQILPYLLTLVLVGGFVGQSLAPKALGR
jgi:simple sugar transport system permease protein